MMEGVGGVCRALRITHSWTLNLPGITCTDNMSLIPTHLKPPRPITELEISGEPITEQLVYHVTESSGDKFQCDTKSWK